VAAAEAKAVANNEPKLAWYVEWGKLLGYRQTWAFAFGKFMDRRHLVVLPVLAAGLSEGAIWDARHPGGDSPRGSVHDDLCGQHRRRLVSHLFYQPGLRAVMPVVCGPCC